MLEAVFLGFLLHRWHFANREWLSHYTTSMHKKGRVCKGKADSVTTGKEKSEPSTVISQVGQGRDFLDAEAIAACSSSPYGKEPWSPNAFERQRDLEVGRLTAWAEEHHLWVSEEILNLRRRGGSEHDLVLIGDPVHTVIKITKGNCFGFFPSINPHAIHWEDQVEMRPATPCQYLQRLHLAKRLAPAMNAGLTGFAIAHGSFVIVTCQRFIAAEAATVPQLEKSLRRQGFIQLCSEIWFRLEDNLLLFDVVPSNILYYRGHIFPVDVIPVIATEAFLRWALALVK